jgi:hypothetical protein
MIMLVFFILGWRLLINKAVPPAVTQSADQSRAQRVEKPATPPPSPPIHVETALPGRGRIAMRIPEPVEVKSPGGRPCIYVAMPAGLFRSLEA